MRGDLADGYEAYASGSIHVPRVQAKRILWIRHLINFLTSRIQVPLRQRLLE